METTKTTNTPQAVDPKIKKIRDADILISGILIAVCAWTAYESIRMSRSAISKGFATWYTAPGLLPLIASIAIILCAFNVIIRAFRDGGDVKFLHPQSLKAIFSHVDAWTAIFVMGLLGMYVFLAIEHLPFTLATLVFLIAFMLVFRTLKIAWILAIAVLYAVGITYFFVTVVGTRFPVMFLDKW